MTTDQGRAVTDRNERLNRLAEVAKEFAGGWLPLSVRYGLAGLMLDGFEAWEAERGAVHHYVTEPYEVSS